MAELAEKAKKLAFGAKIACFLPFFIDTTRYSGLAKFIILLIAVFVKGKIAKKTLKVPFAAYITKI
ncbi:MAG: hypothetical protein II610_09845 [Treponema sp.]|nr:hypothetical protein [Treponema sp.]